MTSISIQPIRPFAYYDALISADLRGSTPIKEISRICLENVANLFLYLANTVIGSINFVATYFRKNEAPKLPAPLQINIVAAERPSECSQKAVAPSPVLEGRIVASPGHLRVPTPPEVMPIPSVPIVDTRHAEGSPITPIRALSQMPPASPVLKDRPPTPPSAPQKPPSPKTIGEEPVIVEKLVAPPSPAAHIPPVARSYCVIS